MEYNKSFKVYYKGTVLESKVDAETILKASKFKLINSVFKTPSCNDLLTAVPDFDLGESELGELNSKPITPQDWARKFIDILSNRHNLVACLNVLCNLNKYDQRNYHELIVELFKSVPNVEVREVELEVHSEREVKKGQYVMFQGNRVKLDDLMNESASPMRKKIRYEFAHGNIPIVVNTQVPVKLEYYVQRTVTSRNRLKVEVLKHNFKDVFLIEKMDSFQLSLIIGNTGTTVSSGNQLKKLTARFILLEHKQDFEKIRQLAHDRLIDVHWIKYNGKNFELVYSGAVETLKEYIDNEQTSFPEKELASSTENKVIITDSPGMGKTSLLANIAHQIISQDNKMLVRFIVLNEFVKELSKGKINVNSILRMIAEQSSEYEFGRKFVEHTLKTGPCALMFDGFDEVHSNQISNAKQILQAAATLPQARIFVATRRNLQDELEKTFQVLGFTIQPFEESNQVEFLLKFWEMKGALSNDSLTNFTKACLKQLTSKMTDSERNIAGIPLQCRLLAEAYEEDAIRCSKVGYQLYEDSNSITLIDSIYGMYERYVNMQFQKMFKQRFSFMRYENIKRVHMYHAIKLVFPDHPILLKKLNTSFLTVNEVCGLGLLEATNSNDTRFDTAHSQNFLLLGLYMKI